MRIVSYNVEWFVSLFDRRGRLLSDDLPSARYGVSRKNPLFAEWTYGQRRLHHEACCDLILAFLAAWECIENRGDFDRWVDCVRQAQALRLG